MMGRALMNDNVVVTANLNGLLFLKDLKIIKKYRKIQEFILY